MAGSLNPSTYRFWITVAGYGRDEDDAERFLDGFAAVHPEVGPVVSQNTAEDTLTVIFSLECATTDEALDRGRMIFAEGAVNTGMELLDIVDIRLTLVAHPAEAKTDERQLQPA